MKTNPHLPRPTYDLSRLVLRVSWRVLTILPLFALTPLGNAATNVVDWGGDYVSVAANFPAAGRAIATNAGVVTWLYTNSLALSPSSGYTTPAGKSGRFFGAIENVGSNGVAMTFNQARILEAGGNDTIAVNSRVYNGTLTNRVSGLIFFEKLDFLNGMSNASQLAFGTNSAMSLAFTETGDSLFRMAVLNGSTWYLSSNALSSAGTLSISDAGAALWSVWDPTGAPLSAAPNSFSVLGTNFLDIQALGFSFSSVGVGSTRAGIVVSAFTASAMPFTAIPEPSTLGLAALASGLGLVLGRRRSA
jgi:hypothetical protein